MRQLPDKINLLAYPWMRAQVLQYCLNPLVRDGNLRLLHRYAPAHVKLPSLCPDSYIDIEETQYAALRSILSRGYREDLIKAEPYHSRMWMGGTPITVDIDARGGLILKDGGHRILFLLVAGVAEIWAHVGTRSATWVEFVRQSDSISDGYAYAKLPHPDFDGCLTGRAESRLEQVARGIEGLGIETAVDLGACSGAFACDLSSVVHYVRGLERDPRFVALARWRAGKCGASVAFEQGDLIDWTGTADLVCILSVLHHVIAARGLPVVESWLAGLSCRYLLLEYPTASEQVLNNSEEARRFAISTPCIMQAAGYMLESNLGLDCGFPQVSRSIELWRKV
jgi:hypothetical protein